MDLAALIFITNFCNIFFYFLNTEKCLMPIKNDLRGIFKYIVFALQSIQNVAIQFGCLMKSIVSLEWMSERFQLRENIGTSAVFISCWWIIYILDLEQRSNTVIPCGKKKSKRGVYPKIREIFSRFYRLKNRVENSAG